MLRDTAQEWSAARMPVAVHRRLRNEGEVRGFDRALWREMSAMGWSGIVADEAHGGVAMGFRSLGMILETLGRSVAGSPLLVSTVGAAGALTLAGDALQQAQWLPRLSSGEAIGTIAIDEHSRHAPRAIETHARRCDDGWLLTGTKRFVPELAGADIVMVLARDDDGIAFYMVDVDAPGVVTAPRAVIDARSHADLTLTDVRVSADRCLAIAPEQVDAVLDRLRVGAAAEMLGLAEGALRMTLDYLSTREQFGRPIGGFQALQHRVADLYTEIELLRSLVQEALDAIDEGRSDLPQLASSAKAVAGDVVHLATNELIQLLGGIAITDEHDAGFYLKRARVLEAEWGNASFHRDRYASLCGA